MLERLKSRLFTIGRRMPIRRKMWMGFFLTALVPLLALGLFGLLLTDRELKQDTGSRMEREVAVRASRISAKLGAHRQTLEYLCDLPSLHLMLTAPTPEIRQVFSKQVEQDLLALSHASQVYQQIRFLDEQGQEQVRVDYRAGPVVVPPAQLQDKKDRTYFRETIGLTPGQVYVSPVELNQEYGKIQVPYAPVLRLGMPVFEEGRLRGIVVLNISAWSFLQDPVGNEQGAELFVVKPDGSYVWHPDSAKAFGGPDDLNTGEGISKDYPEIAGEILTNDGGITHSKSGRMVSFVKLAPAADSRNFLVLVLTERAGVLARLANPMFWGTLALILGAGLASRWAGIALARHIVEPIEELRTGVVRLRTGDLSSRVAVRSEDEIAALADDVNGMAAELQEMYQELEAKVAHRTRTLVEMHHKLQESDRLKSQFLATTSHELRTPLTAVIGFAEELDDETAGPVTPRQKRYVDNILTSATHLLRLINDLLDLSKIEAGRMTVHPEGVPLQPLVAEAASMMAGLARSRGIELFTDVPEDLVVWADRQRVKQVVLNLLSNAVKFTPAGGQVRVLAGPEEGGVRVAVADTGIGIAPEDHDRVFREFEQADRSLARRMEGTGLGLPLSKRLVELMNGTMGLVSRPGEGSCFWFTLPRAQKSGYEGEQV
ncbi:MAG TPA: ATP-binding protein [Symbiobacteriaceae bacterium]